MNLVGLDADEARRATIDIFQQALERQRTKFAGQIHSEADERSVLLTGLLDAAFELIKSHVPGMDVVLTDPSVRRDLVRKMSLEYMPLVYLNPEDVSHVFAEYILWKYGRDEVIERTVKIDYLRDSLQRSFSLMPPEARKSTLALKSHFKWGELV